MSAAGASAGVVSRLQSKLRQSRAALEATDTMSMKLSTETKEEVAAEEPTPAYMFDHRATSVTVWHDLIIVLCVLAMYTIPMNVAFLEIGSSHFISIADYYIDFLFWADILLSFLTTYEDDDGNVVKDWPKIAKRYTLEGSFLSDFISTFPFESMGSGGWKYTRCMRIVRVKRVLKRYHKLTLESDISFLTLSMVKLVVIIIIALHWAACTFYTMARSVNFAEDTWTGNAAPELGELSLSKAYFACLFWATTAFTTVGYGDMSPVSGSEVVDEELGEVQRSEPEFAFSGFFMTLSLLNMVLSSYFIASITIFMTKGDEETSEYRAEAAFVNEFVTKRNVPKQLGKTILQYLQLQHKSRGTTALLASFPAAVKTQVREVLHASMIKQVTLFRGTSEFFTKTIVSSCEEETFMAGMTLLSEFDVVQECYILVEGEAEVLVRVPEDVGGGLEVAGRLGFGALLGGEALLCGQLQPWTIRIATTTTALKLGQAEFDYIANKLSTDFSRLLKNLNSMNAAVIKKAAKDPLVSSAANGSASNGSGAETPPNRGKMYKVADDSPDSPTTPSTNGEDGGVLSRLRRRSSSSEFPSGSSTEEAATGTTDPTRQAAAVRKWLGLMRDFSPKIQSARDRHDQDLAAELCTAASKGNLNDLERLLHTAPSPDLGDYDGRTAIHLACANGMDESLKVLLAHGANPNVKDNFGTTPLFEAVKAGSDPCVSLLLDYGARLDVQDPGGLICNTVSEGMESRPMLERLLKAGISPDASDYDRRTGLHLAAAEGHLGLLRMMINAGAEIEFKDRWGTDALIESVKHERVDIARFLIASGASVNTADKLGFTSLHHAKFLGNFELIQLLEEHGGKIKEVTASSVVGGDQSAKRMAASSDVPAIDYDKLAEKLAPKLASLIGGAPHLQC